MILFVTQSPGGPQAQSDSITTGTRVVPELKALEPGKQLDQTLAKARRAKDNEERVRLLEAALVILEEQYIPEPRITTRDIHRRILDAAPDHAIARKKLGYHRYEKKGWSPPEGKWYLKKDLPRAVQAYEKWKKEQQRIARVATEKIRWNKDSWTRKVAKVRDYFEKDIQSVPGLKMRYYFDIEDVPRPYLLIVEERTNPDPENSARYYGPLLKALRRNFEQAYSGKKILTEWNDEERVLPILLFGDRESYYRYRDHGHEQLPKSDYIGSFYVSKSPNKMWSIFRGMLYVWQMQNDKKFISTLFHEATHQLMHNACADAKMGSTPWVEEGFAEYWGGYQGNIHSGFRFGTIQGLRWYDCLRMSQAYAYKILGKGRGPALTIRQLVYYSRDEFVKDRAGLRGMAGIQRVASAYALGWGFTHFCYNLEDEDGKTPYRKAIEQILQDELRYAYSPRKAAKALGIEEDRDWRDLENRYYYYMNRILPKLDGKEFNPGARRIEVARKKD